MEPVRELVLDETVLFAEDDSGEPFLPSSSAALLSRLGHSDLRVGICYQDNITTKKATIIKALAVSHSLDCIPLCGTCDTVTNFLQAWNGTGSISLLVTSRKNVLFFSELRNVGWRIVCVGADSNNATDDEILNIDNLERVPLTICSLNKTAMKDKSILMVGYVMKQSREKDFAKRGAFPMYPTRNGLVFVPLSFELSLASQLKEVDAVLHKATDEIISIDISLDFSNGILFSKGLNELKRNLEVIPDCCVIDPLNKIYPLLDRYKMQQILGKLDGFNIGAHCKLRAPRFLKIERYDSPDLKDQLSEAKLSFPMIVKPQVACGVSDAHDMALVFKIEDFTNLCVPLPAIVQEYVDHGSSIFKFYVLGNRIFHAAKRSMPSSYHLLSSSNQSSSSPILFNSLKSLPVAQDCTLSSAIDLELVARAAKWLKECLGLTIFGFDVVIQEGSGDHVIVDLNYLPSFKEIPDGDAIPAFWDAIKSSYESWRATVAASS